MEIPKPQFNRSLPEIPQQDVNLNEQSDAQPVGPAQNDSLESAKGSGGIFADPVTGGTGGGEASGVHEMGSNQQDAADASEKIKQQTTNQDETKFPGIQIGSNAYTGDARSTFGARIEGLEDFLKGLGSESGGGATTSSTGSTQGGGGGGASSSSTASRGGGGTTETSHFDGAPDIGSAKEKITGNDSYGPPTLSEMMSKLSKTPADQFGTSMSDIYQMLQSELQSAVNGPETGASSNAYNKGMIADDYKWVGPHSGKTTTNADGSGHTEYKGTYVDDNGNVHDMGVNGSRAADGSEQWVFYDVAKKTDGSVEQNITVINKNADGDTTYAASQNTTTADGQQTTTTTSPAPSGGAAGSETTEDEYIKQQGEKFRETMKNLGLGEAFELPSKWSGPTNVDPADDSGSLIGSAQPNVVTLEGKYGMVGQPGPAPGESDRGGGTPTGHVHQYDDTNGFYTERSEDPSNALDTDPELKESADSSQSQQTSESTAELLENIKLFRPKLEEDN